MSPLKIINLVSGCCNQLSSSKYVSSMSIYHNTKIYLSSQFKFSSGSFIYEIHVFDKILKNFMASIVRETSSFMTIRQFINPNYP